MLQSIRERAQGWIAWIIVGLIIITFALFGIQEYAQGEKKTAVAVVNGEDITATDFLKLYHRQKARLQQQFGDMYDQIVKDDQLRDQVLNALIESSVVEQWAKSHNMAITDAELSMVIQSAKVFQKDGKFDQATYENILNRNGLTVGGFEQEQRDFLLENQSRQLTAISQMAPESLFKQLVDLQYQQRKMNYLRIDQKPLMKMAVISQDQMHSYYEKHKQQYVIPQQISIDYVLLSEDELSEKIKVTDDALQAYYQDNKDQFTEPEQRQASHILIRIDGKTTAEQALKKAQDIRQQIEAGADFSEMAKKYSQDPGSAKLGGDLGLFQQGMMVPAFDKAVFSMKVNEISEPVKTNFGYHLIKLTKIEPKRTKSFAEVKTDVETMYRKKQAEKEYFELQDKLNSISYEQPDTLEPAADAVGMDVKTSEPFSKAGGVDELTQNPKVIKAAFSEEVMKGNNSSSIELSPTSSVVIRVHKVIPTKQQAFDDVKDEVEQSLRKEAGVKASADLAKGILDKVKAGASLKSMARDGVDYHQTDWLDRQNRLVLPQLTAALFKAPKPKDGKTSFSTYELPSGDSVVIEVTGVQKGKEPADKEELSQLKESVAGVLGDAEVKARIQALVSSAKIEKKPIYQKIK
ncbi:SurA N-terminal domain-containing protein [Hydrogenovibrio marinus]|uniref:Periplasmic chaperone PpiD n=1 Tax=Hydrogenovibrio marinus TaxID=28885 RepID=A0A066ZXH0_HYDMR|nr:SurA N-terminal domain-containing protein [Hydrogenovibrio marinus]KDN95051.1 peptidylprolyl isomerase [Hydrogenovibrio marinus]BBN59518.1 peptidylprolyl isomerase [Hydrogenovibrio marinus]